jgi:hypothetical protein
VLIRLRQPAGARRSSDLRRGAPGLFALSRTWRAARLDPISALRNN